MISVSQVEKQFDGRKVVTGIDFSIKPGEIVGILGPNGAGKTTTLRMIAGVLPPSKGTIMIDGINIHNEKDAWKKKSIGFLPENNPLYDEMTVEEYLQFWANIKKIPQSSLKESISFVVDNCGISEVYYRPIAELSKGYRQRVGLSQAILTKPDILILDEPTEGLDPNQRQDIAVLIKNLGKKRTVIISSHVLTEIAKISSRLIVIHKGAIVADNTPEKLRQSGTSKSTVIAEIIGDRVKSSLSTINSVLGVKEEKTHQYIITCDNKSDIREKVFDMAVKNKWKLLTLMKKDQDIEEVFGELTK
jgi:ABC-2 type transport system ATP-binding protein